MSVVARIVLRYLTLPLVALGLILPEEQRTIIADPELVGTVATALGILAPMIAEGWYWAAKRLGWRT